MLTESVDAGKDFTGTTKKDLFIADNGVKTTASAADTLDGGKGEDTFKLYANATSTADITAGSLPTLKNIENVVLYGSKATKVDLTKWDTVETLFLVNSDAATVTTTTLGEKVTTVNLENTTKAQILTFDKALTDATVGVNKVGTTGATPAAASVTVNGTALKTLTVDASGKASNVNLAQTADTIETLNITGKADLTLAYTDATAGAPTTSKIVTIDGSKAEGKLDLDLANTVAATLKTVKTGSADDKLALSIAVASGTTIDLGAGNDKLVAGGGSVVASSTTVIDGGAGIDSLDVALVNSGNAGVFANFETLALTTNVTNFDIAILNKSTITTIAIDGTVGASTLRSVSTSQSLAVNADAASTAAAATTATTELVFKDAAGTADAYTINFAKDAAAAAAPSAGTAVAGTVNAGTVDIAGIEAVTVNSTGKTTTTKNLIDLNAVDAKSLVITGDKALDVTFATTFGTAADATNGKGVATIDASTATGAVNIDLTTGTVNAALNGLTIKGGSANDVITLNQKATVEAGAGNDTIITAADGGTLTGGAGNDTFDIALSTLAAGTSEAATAGFVKVTITDLTAGDTIKFANAGTTETFNKTQINVSTASNLDAALAIAFNDGTAASATNGIISWFQFANNTYIVEDITSGAAIGNGDILVKINGLVDLTNSTLSGSLAGAPELTIA